MTTTMAMAQCLYDLYKEKYDCALDEMKMHKLMYFLQRESLMQNKVVLFDEPFYGWKYGPVLKSVRSAYMRAKSSGMLLFDAGHNDEVGREELDLAQSVVTRYGGLSSWKLSTLSHDELSWKLSRSGLKTGENGDKEMSVFAMKCDAAREKARRKEENGNVA